MRAVPGAGGGAVSLARSLGVPSGAVAAARAVLDGAERRMDLLVDDSDGVVLGALRIPPLGGPPRVRDTDGGVTRPWLQTCRSFVRTLAPARPPPHPGRDRRGCWWRWTG